MKRILLHVCCGVCSFSCIEQLKQKGYCVDGLFYNPNIYPFGEYERRRDAAVAVAKETGITLVQDHYSASEWVNKCGDYKNQPEGGKRCLLCYELRLRKTADACRKGNYDYFTTTLTVSPHKDSLAINGIGKNVGAERFLVCDFKKDDGFKKTIAFAKTANIYRQHYCGCMYSKRDK